MNDEIKRAYEKLATAIVMRAVTDYKFAFSKEAKKTKPTADTPINKAIMSECKVFFNSEWFQTLCDYDGQKLQKAIERKVYRKLGFKNI